jgi:hypothetical protein
MEHRMTTVGENAALLLKAIYDAAAGSMAEFVGIEHVAPKIGLDHPKAMAAARYLAAKGLVEDSTSIGELPWVSLTATGIDAIEEAVRRPHEATRHLPPIFNVLQIGVNHAPIQQGNTSSNQSVTNLTLSPAELPNLAEELSMLLAALRGEATAPDHYAALGKVAEAEIAARSADASSTAAALKAVGPAARWVWEKAQQIGTTVAAAALGKTIGL